MKRFVSCLLVGGLLGLLGGPAALADDATQQMDEVVVTATRSASKTFDVPMPVSVVSQQRLQDTSPASVADALEQVPGVSMYKAGSWESTPIIRGLGVNRVLVLYDGDRETNLWAGRAPLTPFIDVGSVARIEVLKGPASALYGTDALGGVINVITKDVAFADGDKWRFDNTVNSRYSSVDQGWFNRYELAAGGKGMGFRLGVSGRDAGNYKDGNGDEVNNSQFKNQNMDLKALYKLSDTQKLTAAVRINQIDDMGVPQKDPTAPFSHFDKFDTQSYKLGYKGSKMGVFDQVQGKVFYVDQDRSFEGNFPSSTKPVYNLKTNDIQTSAAGTSMQMTLKPLGTHQVITGFELVREDTDSHETQLIMSSTSNKVTKRMTFQPVPDADRMHLGVFAQDEFMLGKRLTVVAGARYDYFTAHSSDVTFTVDSFNSAGAITSSTSSTNHFSDETDKAATFNLGLLYALTQNLHLTSNLASGFRAPDIFERYSTRGGGSMVLIGDPSLNPEYSYNFDLGLKTRFKRFQGEIDFFYNRVDDYIDTVKQETSFVAGIPTYKYTNVQQAELYGFDGSAEFLLIKGLKLFGNVAYVVGRDRDSGDRLNNIPPLNGTLGTRWEAKLSKQVSYWIEVSGQFFHSQDDPAPGEEETPGYGIMNLRAGLRFPSLGPLHDVALVLNIENLFDKYYLSHLRMDDMDFIPEPGLNVITSLRFSF